MPERRSKGDDAIDVEHDGPAKTARGIAGATNDGAARSPLAAVRKAAGVRPITAAVQDALNNLAKDIDGGITKAAPANYTVWRCYEARARWWAADWDPKTVTPHPQ